MTKKSISTFSPFSTNVRQIATVSREKKYWQFHLPPRGDAYARVRPSFTVNYR